MEDNVIKFDNLENPNDDMFCMVYANPSRENYIQKIPEQKKIDGIFLLKDRVKQLKSLCDLAFWVSKANAFGDRIFYSDLSIQSSSHYKYGFVGISFRNKNGIVSERNSPTGFAMFKDLCNGADRIDWRRSDFNTAELVFYVNNIWIDESETEKYDSNELLSPEEVGAYWDGLRNDMLSKYKKEQQAVKSAKENIATDQYLSYIWENQAFPQTPPDAPHKPFDKTAYDAALMKQNIVKDALLSLMLQNGIGCMLYIEKVTKENYRRIGRFGYSLNIQNAALFDNDDKMKLFKRCLNTADEFVFSASQGAGVIALSMSVRNEEKER